jgi:hypothetical protein
MAKTKDRRFFSSYLRLGRAHQQILLCLALIVPEAGNTILRRCDFWTGRVPWGEGGRKAQGLDPILLKNQALTLPTTVYTVRHMRAGKAEKPKRHNCPINVLVRPDQKQRLESEVNRTEVNQSAIVRKALDLLFEQMDRGQLRLGFSDLEQGMHR